jgi:hypothetical protein
VSRCFYWLGPAIIAIAIACTQAEWLNRNFPNYPPLRFDSAAYFSRCLDNLRALEIDGWRAIGAFVRRPDVPGSSALVGSGVLAILLLGNSYTVVLAAVNAFWLTLLGFGAQWQARNLGWKSSWPWPATLVLSWPSVIGMAREFRTELPLIACTSLLAAALLSRRAWKDTLHTVVVALLMIFCVMAKPVSAVLLLPLTIDFLLSHRQERSLHRRLWPDGVILLTCASLVALLLIPSILPLLGYYGAYGEFYEAYGQKLASQDAFSSGRLGRVLYYPANLVTTHLAGSFLILQSIVILCSLLSVGFRNATSHLFVRPLRIAFIYWGFGMVALALYGVRTPAGDFSFVAFVIPLLVTPWMSLIARFENRPADKIVFVFSAGLIVTSLASAIKTPAAGWAGLPVNRVDTASSWGLHKVAETIQLEADNKSPVDVMVLANHTVINYHTVRAELLKTLRLERAIGNTSKAAFYTPPAKDMSHPAVQAATHLLVKSGEGGPSVSWMSEKAPQFYTALKQESGLGVEPMWASPLRLPDNSELMLYKKRLR